jgi:enoyl-CoA hydratase
MDSRKAVLIDTPSGIVVEAESGGVLVVRLDRSDRANTVDKAMHTRLSTVWADIAAIESARAVILTGTGDVFCGGGDRDGWPELVENRRWRGQKMAEARQIVLEMLRFPLPLVAAVNGPAVGLGCSLAIACDMMLMAEDAYLSDPHVPSGLVAGDGGAALLPELLPLPVARRMLFTGERLGAAQALELWLASEVVARSDLDERARAVARNCASQPREAIAGTKRAVNLGLLSRMAVTLDFASQAEEQAFDSDSFRAAYGRHTASRDRQPPVQ